MPHAPKRPDPLRPGDLFLAAIVFVATAAVGIGVVAITIWITSRLLGASTL